jgi:hypothetical protein
MAVSAAFARTFSIVTNIRKTMHYVSEANCFLLQVKLLILKQTDQKCGTYINTIHTRETKKNNIFKNVNSKHANPKKFLNKDKT